METRTGRSVAPRRQRGGAAWTPAGKAAEKVALPAVPALLAPPHQAEITYPNPARATTLLAWKAVPSAATYHVLVDYTPYFNRPLVDRRAGSGSMELRGLDVGKYYWKVAAVDATALEGSFSDFARFTVDRARGRPGDGTAAQAHDRVPGAEQQHPAGEGAHRARGQPDRQRPARGRADDGTFNEFITLEKAGRQTVVIRATHRRRRERERSPVVVAY